jgi:hypothetical protein
VAQARGFRCETLSRAVARPTYGFLFLFLLWEVCDAWD